MIVMNRGAVLLQEISTMYTYTLSACPIHVHVCCIFAVQDVCTDKQGLKAWRFVSCNHEKHINEMFHC